MRFREVEKIITDEGWRLTRVKGSHHQYSHPAKGELVTIPNHSGDIPNVVVKRIFQQAGIKRS